MPENSQRTGEWFAAFYERNYRLVYRLCFTYMKNAAEAEDCTEDVFVKVLTGDIAFHDESHEKKWLTVTAINLCKDRLKHWWRKQVTAMDEAPEAGAKERMYQNILKKAQQAAPAEAPAAPKKKSNPFLRYVLPIAACLCLVVFGAAMLLPRSTPAQPEEGGVLGGNPFVEVENADAFRALAITLDAPDGAQEVSYAVIDRSIAEVRFSLDGKRYLARASAQEGDFSGLYGQESEAETVDAKTSAVLTAVDIGTGICQKISWTNGKINYCLYGTDGADKAQVLAAYEALKK